MAGPSLMVRLLGDVTGLATSFETVAGKAKSVGAGMHTAFRGALDTLNQTGALGPFGTMLATADDGLQKLHGHAKEIGPTMMGIGAVAVGAGAALTAMGDKDKAAHQQLQAAVQASGHSYDAYADKVDAAIKRQEHFGNTADETQNALRVLTQATGSPTTALKDLSIATDLAAAKHEDLTTASGQVAKAVNGSGRLLKELGITTKDASGATKSHAEITSELAQKLTGQASAAANTFTGRLKGLKASITDNVSEFAQKFGPAITGAGAALTGLGGVMTAASSASKALKDSEMLQSAATKIAAAAQWLFNAAMDANPIMIVVLALAALVAAVILAYQHVTWFRAIVDDMGKIVVRVFNDIRGAAEVVFHWIEDHWQLLAAILLGPFALAAYLIKTYWNDIVGFFAGLPGRILGALGDLGGLLVGAGQALLNGLKHGADVAWGDVAGWIGGIPGRITGALGDVASLLYEAGRAIINSLGRGIREAFNDVTGFVGGIAGKLASLKGPLDYDRQLLVPHGKAIMAGLHEGLTAGLSDVNRLMSGVAPGVAHVTVQGATAAATASNSGPAVVVQNAHFNSDVDVDAFMQRAAWVARTARL